MKTESTFTYEGGNRTPNVGGEILYKGKNSNVLERIAYDETVRIEIDENKNGTVDTVTVYSTQTMRVIPNRAPIIDISFPKKIFTNTDLSSVKINSYDPDLDEISLKNNWKINNIVKSNSLNLDNSLFKKHDKIKLTVVAEDNRSESKKTTTVSKAQDVLNSKPVAILKLDKTEIQLGDKISVDASESYDVDNDKLSFIWKTQNRRYNIHDDIYNMGENYLKINENNRSKIEFLGDEINYDMFEEITNYGINLKVDDGDTDGIYDINSSNIRVTPQNLFDRKLILLENLDIENDDIMAVASADLNNDNLKDIALITYKSGDYSGVDRLIILSQDSFGNFKNRLKISLDSEEVYTFNYKSIDISDINNDGLQDISIATGHNKFYTYYQNQDGNFIRKKEYKTKLFPAYTSEPGDYFEPDSISYNTMYLKSTDINNDGKLDIITIGKNYQAEYDTGIDIFIQNENNLTDEKIVHVENYTVDRILTQDMDNNGLDDILTSNSIFYQEDNGSFSEQNFNALSYLIGDNIDNDSSIELVAIDDDRDNLIILKADSNISRNYTTQLEKNIRVPNPNQIEIKDMNHNGKKDIIIGHDGWNFFSLFMQNNDNSYWGNQLYEVDDNLAYSTIPYNLIVDDINNNEKNDVIIFGRKGFEVFYAK